MESLCNLLAQLSILFCTPPAVHLSHGVLFPRAAAAEPSLLPVLPKHLLSSSHQGTCAPVTPHLPNKDKCGDKKCQGTVGELIQQPLQQPPLTLLIFIDGTDSSRPLFPSTAVLDAASMSGVRTPPIASRLAVENGRETQVMTGKKKIESEPGRVLE